MHNLVSVSSSSAALLTLLIVFACFVVASFDDRNAECSNTSCDERLGDKGCSRGKNRRLRRIKEVEELVKKKILKNPIRKIDELCSDLDGTCFVITDDIRKDGNRLLAFRSLRRKGSKGVLTLSQTRLQPPSPLNWENFNSKTWIIRKDFVRLTYAQTMIEGAFLSGGLEFNTTRKQDVLIIGLGGGVINNYLTQMKNQVLNVTAVDIDPVMLKVATKWFGFAESSLHRVVVDDGVRYIHDAARRGEKYDVLLIDLCYNIPLPMMCPIREFLEDDLIASMRAITTDTGAVVVNIITKRGHIQEADKALFPYSRHFPSCYFIGHSEKMLFCSAKDNNSYLNDTDERFHNRFITLDDALGFQLLQRKPGQCLKPSD